MNNAAPTLSQMDLDRLADGELNDAERRQLIARLEATPDGWRRCALAFLEAQEFRRSLAAIVLEEKCDSQRDLMPAIRFETGVTDVPRLHCPVEHEPAEASVKPVANVRQRWFVVAASVALAFASGFGAGRALLLPGRPAPSQASDETRERQPAVEPDFDKAADGARPDVDPRPALPVDAQLVAGAEARNGEVRIVGLVRIADESANVADYVMPVYSGERLDQQWLKQMPLPYSDEQIRKLKREGYNIEQRRQLMQVTLTDGQNLAIPFGTVQLRYVGKEMH